MKSIIEMAREAGLHRHQHNLMSNPMQIRFSYDGYEENLVRFAALVREDFALKFSTEACGKCVIKQAYKYSEKELNALHDAVLAEREACAKVCEEYGESNKGFPLSAKSYAAAIRARSQ